MSELIIDAHQHVWDPGRARYDWLTPELAPIDRTMTFAELEPQLDRAGVSATVLVQSADNDEDTAFMLEVAANNPRIAAVVAYVPLERPSDVATHIEAFRRDTLVVGVRNLIHNNPDPEWLLRPEVDDGLGVLEAAGMTFDLVSVLPEHLALVPILGERHPGLRIVIDHLAKPPIGLRDREPWWSLIAAAAENPLVFAKVSGLYSATDEPDSWTPQLVAPFFDRAMDRFGAERLMYGGDWPISVTAGGYARVWAGLRSMIAELTDADRARILAETATNFYGIDPSHLAAAAAVLGE
ncbi:MAG TPA: amidohydrolase family protein [Galbitalea sp.]|nr:amidohydrolase family protein [Galbitalea sp.]